MTNSGRNRFEVCLKFCILDINANVPFLSINILAFVWLCDVCFFLVFYVFLCVVMTMKIHFYSWLDNFFFTFPFFFFDILLSVCVCADHVDFWIRKKNTEAERV